MDGGGGVDVCECAAKGWEESGGDWRAQNEVKKKRAHPSLIHQFMDWKEVKGSGDFCGRLVDLTKMENRTWGE